jgi:predicted DNA-binding transcriptional regulator YafY
MAITKNPLVRYKILDSCFRNPYKFYTIDVLLHEVNQKIMDIFDDASYCIKLRQLQDDIAFMKSSEGWNVEFADLNEGRKKIYQYADLNFSINNAPLNQIEIDQFQMAIQTLSQFEGMPIFNGIGELLMKLKTNLKTNQSMKPFVGFDRAQDLKGSEYFGLLYNAILNKTPLRILYKDFKNMEPYFFDLHPYYLKEYNNRWFLFGYHQEFKKWDWNVAMDRIESVIPIEIPFIAHDHIVWQDYFSDMIGVTKPDNASIEKIVLHFNALTGKYMETKSIHETQKHKWISQDVLALQIHVLVNYELERLILSYGDSVRVIQPESLVARIAARHKAAGEQYGTI